MDRLIIFSFVSLLVFSSCESDLTKGKFIKGEVIYRAESNYPVGMIKIEDIHIRDVDVYPPSLESPSRAIFYEYDSLLILDLFEEVWFQIFETGHYQYAKNITRTKPEPDTMTAREKYLLLKDIKFNLHNGDKHREGPKHTRIHVNTGLSHYTLQSNPNVALLEYTEVESGRPGTVYIRSSELPLDTTYYYIQYDLQIDTFDIYSLDINHIH